MASWGDGSLSMDCDSLDFGQSFKAWVGEGEDAGLVVFQENSDDYFGDKITPDVCRALAKKLNEMADTAEARKK